MFSKSIWKFTLNHHDCRHLLAKSVLQKPILAVELCTTVFVFLLAATVWLNNHSQYATSHMCISLGVISKYKLVNAVRVSWSTQGESKARYETSLGLPYQECGCHLKRVNRETKKGRKDERRKERRKQRKQRKREWREGKRTQWRIGKNISGCTN